MESKTVAFADVKPDFFQIAGIDQMKQSVIQTACPHFGQQLGQLFSGGYNQLCGERENLTGGRFGIEQLVEVHTAEAAHARNGQILTKIGSVRTQRYPVRERQAQLELRLLGDGGRDSLLFGSRK